MQKPMCLWQVNLPLFTRRRAVLYSLKWCGWHDMPFWGSPKLYAYSARGSLIRVSAHACQRGDQVPAGHTHLYAW